MKNTFEAQYLCKCLRN